MHRSPPDAATPLAETTFCVIDLETTGGSPEGSAITEIGAVKVRGGECLGTFQTLVNPGQAIPRETTVLTGITEAMVVPAPRVEAVLPMLVDFVGDAVVVGHNVRFDLGFLRAALDRAGRERLGNPVVDTCALARRLVRDEVRNCRLSTLAERFRLARRPTHRALDDALATVELLHVLLERAASLGVLGLDDLLQLPTIHGHPQAAKLKLTTSLPRAPGVYLFRDGGGRVLYVGKAANLRQRVRSYFSADDRRKVGQLLRETQRIDHVECAGPFEAAVLEVRLIHRHQPRFNRHAKGRQRAAYVKLTLGERFPRLAVVTAPRRDGALYLGPLPGGGTARRVVEAIEAAVPLRRCSARVPATPCATPCTPAQLGVATCPCSGAISEREYRPLVRRVLRGLTVEPAVLLAPIERRMVAFAAAERFEEAAEERDRGAALVGALKRQRRVDTLRRAGTIRLDGPDVGGAEIVGGLLAARWSDGDRSALPPPPHAPPADGPLDRPVADEVACVAGLLDVHAARLRLVHCDGELASPLPLLPSFAPLVRR